AEGMQPEGLDKEQPKRDREHGHDGPGEKFSGPAVIESREDGDGENAEISERAQTRDGKATNLGVRTSEHLETIGRIAADRGFTAEKNDRDISRFGETNEGNESGHTIKNTFARRGPSRTRLCRCRSS